jgi:hypothetical protein
MLHLRKREHEGLSAEGAYDANTLDALNIGIGPSMHNEGRLLPHFQPVRAADR